MHLLNIILMLDCILLADIYGEPQTINSRCLNSIAIAWKDIYKGDYNFSNSLITVDT